MPNLQEDLLPDHLRDDSDATANRLGNDHLHEEESRRSLTDLIVGAGAVRISTFVHVGRTHSGSPLRGAAGEFILCLMV